MTRRFTAVGAPGAVAASLAIAFVAMLAATSQASLIVNGDFENTTGWTAAGTTGFPPGWGANGGRNNAATQHSGAHAIGGSGTSAYIPAGSGENPQREIEQALAVKTGPNWLFEMDFAAESPGGSGSSFRTLSGAVQQTTSGDLLNIFFIVTGDDADGRGDLMMYTGAANGYQTVLPNAVIYDTDVQASPLTHHLTIEGDFTSGTPGLSVSISDSDGVLHSASGLGSLVLEGNGNPPVNVPATTDALDGIDFVSFNSFLSTGDHLIDNVSIANVVPSAVPEPGTLALAGLGALGMLIWSRRRR